MRREALIRPAVPADWDEIAALLVEVYVGEGFTPAERSGSLRAVAERAMHGDVFVATYEAINRVVGTVCLFPPATPSSQIALPHEGEMRLLAVTDAMRGRGTGEGLTRACLLRAKERGATNLVLSTQTTMVAAQRLYERMGFTRLSERDWERPSSGRRMLVYGISLGGAARDD